MIAQQLSRLDLVVVGGASAAYATLIGDYEQRVGRFVRLQVHEVKGAPLREGAARVVELESARIGDALDRTSAERIVLCDHIGASLTSEAFAGELLGSAPRVAIVIGGACGVSDAIRRRAHLVVAFGAATLPHQLARLVLTEQIYRAFKIARGEPYHH